MEVLDFNKVRVAFEGQFAQITLRDPERLNAISADMADDAMRALQEASKPRRKVRALYLTGEGRGFCAGANLAARGPDAVGNLPVLSRVESSFHPLIRRLRDFPMPLIVGVNGVCVGVGLAICLQADWVVASEEARFSAPYIKLGSAPDCGLTWLLPRVVGPLRARRILMRQERVAAKQAEDWGLVSQVLPADGFAEAARQIALEFAAGPSMALSEVRRLLQEAQRADFETQLAWEARAVERTSRSADNRAGLKAFGSKAAPVFTGE